MNIFEASQIGGHFRSGHRPFPISIDVCLKNVAESGSIYLILKKKNLHKTEQK